MSIKYKNNFSEYTCITLIYYGHLEGFFYRQNSISKMPSVLRKKPTRLHFELMSSASHVFKQNASVGVNSSRG